LERGRTKRVRRDPATTRKLILDATEKIMVDEGYAAVSTRRVAQDVGINPATVHYYFPTTDDLFVALHRRMTDTQLGELQAVLASASPIEALWKFQSEWGQTALAVEFLALSNHRKNIQAQLAAYTDAARAAQARALDEAMRQAVGADPAIPPVALTTILIAVARTLANEERVGITRGHREVRELVEHALRRLGGPPPGSEAAP
jgi:AcrR family transcriptional regulator